MGSKHSVRFDVRFRDTDAMGHVNNAVFATYLESVRINWYNSLEQSKIPEMILARLEIDYKLQIKIEHKIQVDMWVSKIGTKSWTFEYEIMDYTNNQTFAIAKTVIVCYDYKEHRSIPIPEFMKSEVEKLVI